MVDSENNALEVGKTVFPTYTSKREVLDRVRELAHGETVPDKDEVDYLKTCLLYTSPSPRDRG